MPDPSHLLIARVRLLTRPSDVTIYGLSGTVHPLPDLSVEPQRAS